MSDWRSNCVQRLASANAWGYAAGATSATEPAALAALALLASGREEFVRPVDWLLQRQNPDGSVGVTASQSTPGWPTSLAVLAWHGTSHGAQNARREDCRGAVERGVQWLLSAHGKRVEHDDRHGKTHDYTLVGWPWIDGTHSWIEPTSLAVLALKSIGHANHARVREAVRLLVDRLLPDGGCNYGNTFVLGQQLPPHVQPTGLCLLALAGEKINDPRLAKSRDYLRRELSPQSGTPSLCFGLLGLAAHHEPHERAEKMLAAKFARSDDSPYKLALLALAALGVHSLLTGASITPH